MSIDFKIRDFAYPVHVIYLRTFLERSQWFTREQLEKYQLKKLTTILEHAYENVPYYSVLFDENGIRPRDITSLKDLHKIPTLKKETINKNFDKLVARNAKKYRPVLYKTSGTTGVPLCFYLDKYNYITEFCYYWRYWSWAGYRLGMPFADLTFHYFLVGKIDDISCFSPLTGKLNLNPTRMSYETIDTFVNEIKKHKVRFLKGSPSSIYIFSLLLEKKGYADLSFKAVFTMGEPLLPHQREKIEKVFHCRVLDSYGHMESTVAISQCPEGNYHLHSEYGILEIQRSDKLSSGTSTTGSIVGTSLHSMAMPLVRYEIKDLIEVDPACRTCECGRGLPIIKKIYGRTQDIIVTPDNRFITNVFIYFSYWEGVAWIQLVQDKLDRFRLVMVKDSDFKEDRHAANLEKLRKILGRNATIECEFISPDELRKIRKKYTPVISRINIENYL